ncbi:hypothetical protein PFISCL1PPCAC_18967, partial [Pristionchus fissidentatus]
SRMSLDPDPSLVDLVKEKLPLDTSLLDLPDEIIEMIISHLDFTDQSRIILENRLRRIEERMEERGEGSKEEFEQLLISTFSSSVYGLTVNDKWNLGISLSIVTIAMSRLRGHILDICIFVDPHEISHFSLLEVICENTNKEVYIFTKDTQVFIVSPLTSKFDLSFLIRFIKKGTGLFINFVCPSLTFDDVIELSRAISCAGDHFDYIILTLPLNFAKIFADRFMGVAPSYFDQTEPPFDPESTDDSILV